MNEIKLCRNCGLEKRLDWIELLDCPMKERFLNYALPSHIYSVSDGRVFLTPNGIVLVYNQQV